MSDFNTKSGYWFRVENGVIVEQSWGVPGPLSDQSIQTIRGAGWFPGLVTQDESKDVLGYTHATTLTLAGDVVQIAITSTPRPLADVQADAVKRINAEAADQYSRYDADLIAVNRGRALLPEKKSAIDHIATAASGARSTIQSALTVDDVLSVFPVLWVVA